MKEKEIIKIGLSKEQLNAFEYLMLDKNVSRLIYGGQAGGGKSFLISLWLHTMCVNYKTTRYYLAREVLKDIKESILLTYFDVLSILKFQIHYNSSNGIITYPNGSQIYLIETFAYPSDPNFESLGSREYTAGAIEEGTTTTKRAADLLLSRTRYKHDIYNLFPKQLITCNPSDGWIKDTIVIPQLEGTKKKDNEIFIRATLDSNPNKKFVDQYKKTLEENLNSFDKSRLLNGDWNSKPKSGSEFFKEFNHEIHVSKTHYDPSLPLHITFDENVHPYVTCEVWQIQQWGSVRHVVQLDEICKPPPSNSRKKVCEAFSEKFRHHTSGVFVYGDATSQKKDTAKEYGDNFFTDIVLFLKKFNPVLRVPPINPSVASSGGFINIILEKNYRNIKIIIDPICKLSISDYAYAQEDANGGVLKKRITNPETGISYEKNGHHCDALRYFICFVFASDFNYYLSGGVEANYSIGNDHIYKFNR